MKKSLSLLSLAALTIGLLGSCSKINERLDNLDKRVDAIESEQIASINTQITNINSSIADLGQIRSDITSLKQSAENHGQDIFALQEADEALGNRIDNLEDYLDVTLPTFAEKDWVIATFSTLEQYEATCDTIAKIEAKLGTTSEKLSKDIKACADSLTKWVNKTFEGYYTAAQMDAKLTQMKAAIDSAKSAGGITDAKADSIAAELTKTKTAVDTAKANIRKEYRAAIDTAIKTSEGKLTKAIQEKITEVNGKIESLTTRVGNLETSVSALTGRVEKLEKMIQSVTIVPAYSDGSVEIANDSLYIDCIVSPSKAVTNLAADDVAILVNKVKTKANSGVDTIKINGGNVFGKNADKGTISVRVFIKNKIPAADSTITVAVNVKNGVSNYTTEFVPVTLPPVSVSLDKHSIFVQSPDSDKDTTLIATVKNSIKGVTWTSSNADIATVDVNGKVTIKANVSGKDTIVVKTVEGAKTDTCFVSVLPKGALAGEFTVNAEGKKVHFSQGNLYYDGSNWGFEAEQYYFRTYEDNGKCDADGYNRDSGTTSGHWGLFGWVGASSTTFTTSPEIYGVSTSSNNSDYGITSGEALKTDWGTAIDNKGTWTTLTGGDNGEWKYLFDNHVNVWGTCNDVPGRFIAPDGFAGDADALSTAVSDWASAQAAGIVFLPASGNRPSSSVTNVGNNGVYWSSTALDGNSAYNVFFYRSNVNPGYNAYRKFGYSVRLITESK